MHDKRASSQNFVYNPASHQRIAEEHGPAPDHRDVHSHGQKRVQIEFWPGIIRQMLKIRRPTEAYV